MRSLSKYLARLHLEKILLTNIETLFRTETRGNFGILLYMIVLGANNVVIKHTFYVKVSWNKTLRRIKIEGLSPPPF